MQDRTQMEEIEQTRNTSKENGIDQKTNSVNMDSDQQSDPGITSREVIKH